MSTRDEWLEWRRQGVGASDIGALLGLSRYSSPYSLWAEKVGLLPATEESERQWIGREFEPVLAKLVEKRTGLFVSGEQMWCSHPNEPWMRATIDGLLHEDRAEANGVDPAVDFAVGLVEFKTDGRFGWTEIPPNYQAQAQWQMAVTGLPQVVFGVLFAGFKFETFTIERDEADIAFMVERARSFWFDYVVPGAPPPTDGSDATLDALAAIYDEPIPGSSIELTPDVVGVHQDWRVAKGYVKHWAQRVKDAEAQLKVALEDHEEGTIGGEPVVSWRQQVRQSYTVQEATFRVLRPVNPKKETSRARS
jgi:putative phage-type endonuclease